MEITRRKAITEFLSVTGIPFIVGSDGVVLLVMPVITPEEFLVQCNASLKVCWGLLRHSGFDAVQSVLHASLPMLLPIAKAPGIHRDIAAALAAQAKMLQALVAKHYYADLIGCEIACAEAVRYAEAAGDPRVRAAALLDYAMAHLTKSPSRPDKAIPLFLEALQHSDAVAAAQRSDIYVCLATAYAANGDEVEAMQALEQSERALSVPPASRQDLDYLYGQGFPEFAVQKGRTYLLLAPHFSSNHYFQQAYDIFAMPSASMTTRGSSACAINQADAARGLGELGHFVELLERGLLLALEIGSKKRVSEAIEVFRRIPESWQRETSIQRLRRHLLPCLTTI